MLVGDVIPQVGFAREAHRTAVDSALEESLVGVLSQVLAQRLTTEEALADLTFDFLLRVVIGRLSMERLVEEKFGVRVGAVKV